MLSVLYLRGLSSGDFAPALSEFFGTDAGLSATSITRLVETWSGEYTAFESRDLSDSDFVYMWADGAHFRIRLEEDRLCCLVVIGVKADGTKELLACSDGYRESTESWADVLQDLKKRGMTAPAVAVGDGALGFWAALGDVFPDTWGVSGVLCKRQGSWCVSFLSDVVLQVEGYLAGEEDRELVQGCCPVFDRVRPFLLRVA